MPSSEGIYGGTFGSRFRLRQDVTLLYQEPSNNRSRVRITAYMYLSGTNPGVWNTNATYANIQYNGNLVNTSINGYDSRNGNGGPWFFATGNYDVWIPHNSDGSKTATFYVYHNATNSPNITDASTTLDYTLPDLKTVATLSTTSASSINPTSVVVGGNVTNSGNDTITQRGIYYSTSDTTPDSGDLRKTVAGTTGSFSTTLTGLTPNTTYYYRAYAINAQGTGYGTVKSFRTNVTPFATLTYNNTSVYADGKLMQYAGASWSNVTGDLYFETRSEEGATTVPQLTIEPGQMIKNILDFATSLGGQITYDEDSIDDTGTSVSYTFVSQTCFEAINTVLSLSPANWYWYIDPATNKLHFHEKSATAEHKFTMGKDIITTEIDKRADDIINTVYFTGGDTGGGAILYRKYQDAESIGKYGVRDTKVIDQRVTVVATAELISTNLLTRKSTPEVRLTADIADSNSLTGAYDIESVKIGDVLLLRNVKGGDDSADLDINDLALQIVRKVYTASKLTVFCSTIPPEITKRIEDIKRNLDSSITINNPGTPS